MNKRETKFSKLINSIRRLGNHKKDIDSDMNELLDILDQYDPFAIEKEELYTYKAELDKLSEIKIRNDELLAKSERMARINKLLLILLTAEDKYFEDLKLQIGSHIG